MIFFGFTAGVIVGIGIGFLLGIMLVEGILTED